MANPLGYWASPVGQHPLAVGDVLRAREAEADDPYAVVRVVAITPTPTDTFEAVIAPAFEFGENISAAMTGEGSILRHFDVLTAAEVAELTPDAAESDDRAGWTDVTSAKAALAAARVEGR